MVPHLDPDDFFYASLCLAISKSGEFFFWPLKISDKGRSNMWNESALEIAKKPPKAGSKFDPGRRTAKAAGITKRKSRQPIRRSDWPKKELKELYDIAFKGDRISIESITWSSESDRGKSSNAGGNADPGMLQTVWVVDTEFVPNVLVLSSNLLIGIRIA